LKPYISVLIACKNGEQYIQECVNSVLSQSFQNFEIIIVDDGSTDSSGQLITDLAKVDCRIKCIYNNASQGPAAARNSAALIAEGEWFSILDADDVYHPDKLAEQILLCRKLENLVIVGSGSIQINQGGFYLSEHSYPESSNELIENLLLQKNFPPHSSIMYRAAAFNKINGFDRSFELAQDYDIWLRMSEIGSFAVCGKPLVKIRLHDQSIGRKITLKGYSQAEYAVTARVLQLMRRQKNLDPNIHADPYTINKILKLVSTVFEQTKRFEYLTWRGNLKDVLYINRDKYKMWAILKFCVRNPRLSLQLLVERKFGFRLSEKIFRSMKSV